MKNGNKKLNNIYIPEVHKKYDVLPTHRKYNVEMIVWDHGLLDKIQKLTNMNDHTICPYQRYKSYEEFFDEIDSWINKFPNYEQEITEYKNSIIKMNNKDLWAIVQYIGKSDRSFTKNKYYYVVMYVENNSWMVRGIIDNEEYDAFITWSPNPVDFFKDFRIILDPNNRLKEELELGMSSVHKH